MGVGEWLLGGAIWLLVFSECHLGGATWVLVCWDLVSELYGCPLDARPTQILISPIVCSLSRHMLYIGVHVWACGAE